MRSYSFWFFGVLMDLEILALTLGRMGFDQVGKGFAETVLETYPAVFLNKSRRVVDNCARRRIDPNAKPGVGPVIVDCNGDCVEGVVLEKVSHAEALRLIALEILAVGYGLGKCSLLRITGSEPCSPYVFLPTGDLTAIAKDRPWELEHFQKRHKQRYIQRLFVNQSYLRLATTGNIEWDGSRIGSLVSMGCGSR